MSIDQLPLPVEFQAVIDNHKWPLTDDERRRQILESWVPAERVRLIAPDEDHISFYCPPFPTVAHRIQNGGEAAFWDSGDAAPTEINFETAVVIGDFGIGSDSPIILDYQASKSTPSVKRLKWGPGPQCDNHWIEISPTFAQFAEKLGL